MKSSTDTVLCVERRDIKQAIVDRNEEVAT
jgi:hypothetical protein